MRRLWETDAADNDLWLAALCPLSAAPSVAEAVNKWTNLGTEARERA